jgi:hypothetical protein
MAVQTGALGARAAGRAARSALDGARETEPVVWLHHDLDRLPVGHGLVASGHAVEVDGPVLGAAGLDAAVEDVHGAG